MNKCIFTGRFTAAPKMQNTEKSHRCFFTLMVNNHNKKADGTKYPAQAVDFVAWGKNADLICQFKDKGHLVLVEAEYSTYERDAIDFNNQPIANARKVQKPIFTVNRVEFMPVNTSNANNQNQETNSNVNPADIPTYNSADYQTTSAPADGGLPFNFDGEDDPFGLNEI